MAPSNNHRRPSPRDLLPRVPIGHPDSMMSVESVRRAAQDFMTRPSDVIVATFPKTGTTLVTWTCHLLRTGAREETMKLDDVETFYELCPWPMLSWDVGIDPNTAQQESLEDGDGGGSFGPRIFKSHLRMASVYPGCKYVVTIRNPGRTALSFYNFFIAKRVPFVVQPPENNEEDGASTEPRLLIDASTFLVDTPFVKGNDMRASIWEYYAEYHALMPCPDVLMLIYEDFAGDEATRKENIRLLGRFMGIFDRPNNNGDGNANDEGHYCNKRDENELIERAAAMSTKSYMAQHMSKFDEPYERAKQLGRAADVSQMAPGAKIALQKHTQMYDGGAKRFLDERWKDTMGPLGYADYDEFCDAVRDRNRELFGWK